MKISWEEKKGIALCSLKGELTIDTADQLKKELSALSAPPRSVIINCTGLTYLDSTGIATILGLAKTLEEAAAKMFLCCLSPKLRTVLRITRLDSVLAICDSQQEALQQCLNPPQRQQE